MEIKISISNANMRRYRLMITCSPMQWRISSFDNALGAMFAVLWIRKRRGEGRDGEINRLKVVLKVSSHDYRDVSTFGTQHLVEGFSHDVSNIQY